MRSDWGVCLLGRYVYQAAYGRLNKHVLLAVAQSQSQPGAHGWCKTTQPIRSWSENVPTGKQKMEQGKENVQIKRSTAGSYGHTYLIFRFSSLSRTILEESGGR